MRPALAIFVAFIAGILIALVDMHGTLPAPWNGYAYYAGIDLIVVLIAFLLTYERKSVFLFASSFFGIEAWWNFVWGLVIGELGLLSFPLDLGLGQYTSEFDYFIGIIVQMALSFILYLLYRITRKGSPGQI